MMPSPSLIVGKFESLKSFAVRFVTSWLINWKSGWGSVAAWSIVDVQVEVASMELYLRSM